VATGHGLKDPDTVLRRSRPIISVNADANELIKVLEDQRKPEH